MSDYQSLLILCVTALVPTFHLKLRFIFYSKMHCSASASVSQELQDVAIYRRDTVQLKEKRQSLNQLQQTIIDDYNIPLLPLY